MKIESEATKKTVPVMEKFSLNRIRIFSPEFEMPDFESCIKELDEDKNISPVSLPCHSELDSESIQQSEQVLNDKKMLKQVQHDNLCFDIMSHQHFVLSINEDQTKINHDDFKKKDVEFFKVCIENNAVTLNNLNAQNLQVNLAVQNPQGVVSYRSLDVSKGLFNLIEYSFKAKRPVRLDFNGDSSVILKMNKEGKLIAEFISNDEAMAYVLKSSIPGLKNKMDAEGIPYEEIFYNDNKKNKDKKQNKGGNE